MIPNLEADVDSPDGHESPVIAEIELGAFWYGLWRSRLLLTVLSLVGAVVGVAATFILPRYYVAQTSLLPAQSSPLSGALGSLGNLGALASLAGVNVSGGKDQSVEAIAILTSRQFTLAFIRDHGLLPALFPRKWDADRARWKVPDSRVPSEGDAFRRFDRKVRRVSQDKKTGLIVLAVRWRDPDEAALLANDLVIRLNHAMQTRAVTESQAAIRQLQIQLEQTDVVPLREALAQVLESEVKNKTLAVVREEYAMRVVDPAIAPALREYVFPRRSTFAGGGALLGLLLGVLLVGAGQLLRKSA